MLVDTESTSEQFITRLTVDMISKDISIDGYRIFVTFMVIVDIHLKIEYFKQEKPLALWN